MALLYADENFDYGVIEFLRQLGHDILTVQDAGATSGDDARVLSDATAVGRTVLTFNRRHFERLHRQNSAHAGIISATWDADRAALAGRIHDTIAAAGLLAGKHLRVNRSSAP